MAQLFPGFFLLNAITVCMSPAEDATGQSIAGIIIGHVNKLISNTGHTVLTVIFSIMLGMLIHGIHWAVLACLENQNSTPVRDRPWHRQRIFIQIIVMPVCMIWELRLLLKSRGIIQLAMEENVPHFDPKFMDNYSFLQDFYLNFGQFYSHMAYSLLFSLPFLLASFIGFTDRPLPIIAFMIGIYLFIGLMITLGRVQLSTLFIAENEIKKRSNSSPSYKQ